MSDGQSESGGLTRSGLIKAGAVAALVAGTGGTGAALAGAAGLGAAAPGIGKPKPGAAYLHHASYVPLVGTTFRVHRPEARALRVKLIEARKLRSRGESFSLLFRGKPQAGFGSGIFRLQHPALGDFELFIGPVDRGVKGLHLEAVINRIAT